MFQLNTRNFIRGAASAVFGGVGFALYSMFFQDGQLAVDLWTVDWSLVLKTAVNAAVAAFVGYISLNFFSNKEGKVLGKY